jgi:hypothetical protein
MRLQLRAVMLCVAAVLVGDEAQATDAPIALGEVAPPPASFGVDAGALHDAAAGAIRQLDVSQIRRRSSVVVSIAMTRVAIDPVDCTVNATVRDTRTGAMIAIIEASAHAAGPVSAAVRKQVADAAVRKAISRVPTALGAK